MTNTKTSLAICAHIMGFTLTGIIHSNAAISTLMVASEESNRYSTAFGDSSFAKISAPAPFGNFAHDFSSLGEEVWTITWRAPLGQYIEIAAPTGSNSTLLVQVQTDGSFGNVQNSHTPLVTTIVLSGETGDLVGAPTSNFMVLPAGPTTPGPGFATGAFANISWNLTPGQTSRFTSIKMSGTIPAGYDTNVNRVFDRLYVEGSARDSSGSGLPDPGQWVSLQTIPEPSSALLSFVGIAAIGLRRRRTS